MTRPADEPPAEPFTVARARKAGKARAEGQTAEQRQEVARSGASVANSPASRARSIVKAWATMSEDERGEVRSILRRGGVIR